MKWLISLLGLIVGVIYVLQASQALEFKNKTLDRTEVTERVAFMPTFHPDRLSSYFSDQWDRIRKLVSERMDRESSGIHQ